MKFRLFLVVGGSLIALSAVVYFVSPRQEAQTADQPAESPIVVQRGVLTGQERAFSREYERLYSRRRAATLSSLVQLGARDEHRTEVGVSIGEPSIPTVGANSPEDTLTGVDFLSLMACRADAVVRGTPTSQSAHLTADDTFAFTVYDFAVNAVLKNNAMSAISEHGNIQIARPGALIKLDGQVIRLQDGAYKALQLEKEYLLFLKFVPGANGYLFSSTSGDVVIENGTVKHLRRSLLPDDAGSIHDAAAYVGQVRSAVGSVCGNTAGAPQ